MNRRQFLAASAASLTVSACRREGTQARLRTVDPTPPRADAVAQVLLVDAGGAGRFGAYLEELLAVEGLAGVHRVQPADVTPAVLADVPSAVIYGGPLPAAWVGALAAFVEGGGSVTAIDPGSEWLARLAIDDLGPLPALDDVQFADMGEEPGLTVKVVGRRWRIGAGAGVDATFEREDSPAVVTVQRGSGRATCWAFDLPRSIALRRQGNPAWANTERDDYPLVRYVDLTVGWVRPELLDRPDADLQQRHLVDRLAEGCGLAAGPLLALDYFPGDARAVLIATGDAHGVGADVLEDLLGRVEAGGGRMTVYYEPRSTPQWRRLARRARWAAADLPLIGSALHSAMGPPSPHEVEAMRARGHEFAPHPPAVPSLDEGLAAALTRFEEDGYGTHHLSVRTHAIMWKDWVANARAHRGVGIRMNLDVYQVGSAMQQADGGWSHGHLVGSGLPARFVDETGTVIDCYQQPTQIVDEQLLGVMGGHENLSGVDAAAVAETQIARAVGGTPAALGWVVHFDSFVPAVGRAHEAGPFVDGVLAAAGRARVPVWPAKRWLAFLDARRETRLAERRWDAATLRLSAVVQVSAQAESGVSLMVPTASAGARLEAVTVDGTPATLHEPSRGGRAWTCCILRPGTSRVEAQYRRA